MFTKSFQLEGFGADARLDAYIIENSKEYDDGKLRPAMLVLPGGGYQFTSDREAQFVALAYLAKGYNAFILRYSVKTLMTQILLEAAKSIAFIRDNAAEWHIDANRVAVVGFSAGGHLASCMATLWNRKEMSELTGLPNEKIKPNAAILSYAVLLAPIPHVENDESGHKQVMEMMYRTMSGKDDYTPADIQKYSADLQVDCDTSPSFLWTTAEDTTVLPIHSIKYAAAMLEHNRPCELHMYTRGNHGLSLANENTAGHPDMVQPHVQNWLDMSVTWLEKEMK